MQDFIKELTSLANSEQKMRLETADKMYGDLLGNQIVAFLVLKEFVHLDDVGVIL